MAQAHVASPSSAFLLYASAARSAVPRAANRLPPCSKSLCATSFKVGSPLVHDLTTRRTCECRRIWVPIRCEQGAKESRALGLWLGRLAMVGFATAITVEIVTGKGLLENFGFVTPLPGLALVITTLVGILTAVFIFQSATRD